MTNGHSKGEHAASAASKKRAARERTSAIVAALAAAALVVIAAASWRLSAAEHTTAATTSSGPNAIEIALMDTLTRSDLLATMEEQAVNIADIQAEILEQAKTDAEDDGPAPLADFEPADLDSFPSSAQLATFSLFDDAPELDQENTDAINDAIHAAERLGNVGVVFMDASTGNGISYNADAAIYGASSFKGPYAVYVCQELVDGGQITLDSPVDVVSTSPGSIAISPTSTWATSEASTYSTGILIDAAVTESDNDAYGMLRNQYDGRGYDAWIAGLSVSDAPRDPLSWYPTYCARSSLKLWANALFYLESDSQTAAWLSDLFEQTRTSFIRDGIVGTEGGRSATVRDKAGWISDPESAYNAVCDAGIIEIDGRTYLMSIMTSQPDCVEARSNVRAIAAALFKARDSLS